MPLYIPEPLTAPNEPQIWEEKCPGCKHTYAVTAKTHWNQCSRCEGQFCQRCITTDGECFACAIATHPGEYPCENCRKMVPENTMGSFDEGEDLPLLTVCQPCWRSMENHRIARRHQDLKARGERAGWQELSSILATFGASYFEDLNREAGRDYSAMHAERFGTSTEVR